MDVIKKAQMNDSEKELLSLNERIKNAIYSISNMKLNVEKLTEKADVDHDSIIGFNKEIDFIKFRIKENEDKDREEGKKTSEKIEKIRSELKETKESFSKEIMSNKIKLASISSIISVGLLKIFDNIKS